MSLLQQLSSQSSLFLWRRANLGIGESKDKTVAKLTLSRAERALYMRIPLFQVCVGGLARFKQSDGYNTS